MLWFVYRLFLIILIIKMIFFLRLVPQFLGVFCSFSVPCFNGQRDMYINGSRTFLCL